MKYRSLLLFVLLLLSVGMPLMAQDEMAEPDLRIGVLPVLNVYPIYAGGIGFFEAMGISVVIAPKFSAQELREGLASGELDGFQADLITTLVLLEEGYDVRLVRHVGMVSPPLFGILTNEGSGIMSVEDLVGARIGISEKTVVQYVTDLMLASAGVDPADVEYVNIPGIEARSEMLAAGEVDAATLPQPFYKLSVEAGANVLIDDSVLDYVPEAISFLSGALMEKGDQVRDLMNAYEAALHWINEQETFEEGAAAITGGHSISELTAHAEEAGGQNLVQYMRVMLEAEIWPSVTPARVPTAEEFAHAQDWALGVGLVMEARAYEDVIDGSFLPEMMDDDMDDDMSEEDEE